MMRLKDTKILMFVADEYEDLELQYPRYRLIEEGAHLTVAGEKAHETYKGRKGYPCKSDIAFDDVDAQAFDALILAGGYAPDKLRAIPKVLEVVKHFHQHQKLIAFICHAGWIPISAQVIKGVKCTSYHTIKDDMKNAGAIWVDEKVVIDRHFISSRSPDDLPHFCPAVINHLSKVTSPR